MAMLRVLPGVLGAAMICTLAGACGGQADRPQLEGESSSGGSTGSEATSSALCRRIIDSSTVGVLGWVAKAPADATDSLTCRLEADKGSVGVSRIPAVGDSESERQSAAKRAYEDACSTTPPSGGGASQSPAEVVTDVPKAMACRRSSSKTSGRAVLTVLSDSGVLFEVDVVHLTGVREEDLNATLVSVASDATENF